MFCLRSIELVERVELDFVGEELHAEECIHVVVDDHDAEERPQVAHNVHTRAEYGVHDLDAGHQVDEAKDEQHVDDTRQAPDARRPIGHVDFPIICIYRSVDLFYDFYFAHAFELT